MKLPTGGGRIVTAEEMSALDRGAIQGRGIPSLTLMERAGTAAARSIAAWWRGVSGGLGGAAGGGDAARPRRSPGRDAARSRAMSRMGTRLGPVLVLCGPGNNGGDGFVVARKLREAGYVVRAIVAAEEEALSPDARHNYEMCARTKVPVTFLPDPRSWGAGSEAADAANGSAFLVDALLGTGSRGAPHGVVAAAIELATHCDRPIVSLDIPTGVDASSGHVAIPAIRADLTITFGQRKVGQVLEPGSSQCGVIEVADIGIPQDLVEEQTPSFVVADAAWVRAALPSRPRHAHKGSVGRVLLVGGSAGMMGAVALASESALRAGAGYVAAAVPRSCVDILEARVAEVVKRGLAETSGRTLSLDAVDAILAEAMRADAIAIGPGLSRDPETEELVRALLDRVEGPVVLDADGLNAFEGKLLHHAHGPLVITPHYGEAARLTGESVSEVACDPPGWARRYAEATGAIVSLKSVPMLTAARATPTVLNATGTPGMATAGSGDVLTGTIASLLAQGMPPVEAAAAGCFIHGLAGEVAVRRQGLRGVVAGDIRDALPAAFVALESGALDGA